MPPMMPGSFEPSTYHRAQSVRVPLQTSIAPSEDIARFRPPSTFLLSNPLLHIFISYRAASDRDSARELYEAAVSLSRESAYSIPAGARGRRCPAVAAAKSAPSNECKIFLDQFSLLDGRDWEAGFVLGLAHSIVIVPLLSWGPGDKGSVGQMVELQDEQDREDNVLMEFILALALKRHDHGSVQAIYPVLVGMRQQDGSFAEFPFAELRRLPDKPSVATNARAAKIMAMLGLPQTIIDDMRNMSVREIVYAILRSQGCKLSQLEVSQTWQDQCATRILELLMREVRTLLDAPSAVSRTRPGAEEMLAWLRECGLQQLAPVCISSGLSSLEGMATISGRRLRELCTSYAQSRSACSVKFDEDLFARFDIMRGRLVKSDLRAKSMTIRLNRFVDNKVSWAAAFSSTSAVEIAASGWRGQIVCAVLCVFHFLLFAGNVEPNMSWQGKDRQVGRWTDYQSLATYIVLTIGLAAFVVVGLFLARPFRAKGILQASVLLCAIMTLFSPVVEAAQLYLNKHDPHWSFSLYVWHRTSSGGYSLMFFSDLSWCVLYFAIALAMRRRQEWVTAILHFAMFWFTLERYLRYAAFRSLSTANLVFYAGIFLFCTTAAGFIYWKTKSAAAAAHVVVSSHAHELARIWNGERDEHRAYDETLRIEEKLEEEKRLALVRASGILNGMLLRRVFRQAHEGLPGSHRRYSLAGKVRQETSDIQALFIRAALINDTFQDYMEQLVADFNGRNGHEDVVLIRGPVKSPERALQKCVRTYRRDAGCLTDLVRCTLVAKTPQQAMDLCAEIQSVSIVHSMRPGVDKEGRLEPRVRMKDRVSPEADVESGPLCEALGQHAMFRITGCKNRFRAGSKHFTQETGFRNIVFTIQVGWEFREEECMLVPVSMWRELDADTLICEIQIHLESLYNRCARSDNISNYKSYRDLLAQ